MRSLRGAALLLLLALLPAGRGAVITGACDRDQQCGGGMCCAVSLWIRSLRMCTPMGNVGEECHPLSHRLRGVIPAGCVVGDPGWAGLCRGRALLTPPFLIPGALPGAADAPHLPLPPQPGLHTGIPQQVQVFARLQERRRLLLAGAAGHEEEPPVFCVWL
ncbi:UNVERIFIED_CONTAM: hypothetical protein H355_008392 [Colinus virginianus]|nr:hypothetical protein H355_008392 [Colinus virginianus]